MKKIALIGTFDTKGDEFAFLKKVVENQGCETLTIDAGVQSQGKLAADIPNTEVAAAAGHDLARLVERNDRGTAVVAMLEGAAVIAKRIEPEIAGIIGMGGSAGTNIGTSAMRALPIGMPKVMVSSVVAGDVKPYGQGKDICFMYSVVDISGINAFSAQILTNAAYAIVGMARAPKVSRDDSRPLLAATMFGVTTPCVSRAAAILDAAGYEALVFHATGTGGMAMESLIESGIIRGVLDVTTTEWCDELVGGDLSAGPHRLEPAARMGIPFVVSVGALDMVNFGPIDEVPEKFKNRQLYRHNPTITLMRTNVEENAELGKIIASKANMAKGKAAVYLPLRGVSALDAEGQPFDWLEARNALYAAIRANLDRSRVELVELDLHINDPAFAEAMANKLLSFL
ncbi:MAG: Tm-1-like ATP-binding domain-containing protein [Planctomycetota bacterium]|jgi:uncharacterized protein (UPF0261 family)|nr:Tm-1-like ATP-binding domain-containing protein [Planctomycetota bacterium]